MKFLCLYKSAKPEGTPPTEKEMAEMGKLIEDWMKSGRLLDRGMPAKRAGGADSALQRKVQRGGWPVHRS
jgi:hypothetical protein